MSRPARPPAAVREHLEVMRACRLPGWLREALDPDLCATALRGGIGALVPGALGVQRVTLEDARARRECWALRYAADVTTRDGDRTVTLVAELHPPGNAPTPSDTPWLVLPELRLRVRAVSADPGLPVLPTLLEPATARVLLEHALHGSGRRDLRLAAAEPRLARYKPGNRATVVCRLRYPNGADPDWPLAVVAKTYRGNEGASTHAAMRALWQVPPRGRHAPRLAEPFAYLPDSKLLLQSLVPGDRTLSDVLKHSASTDQADDGSRSGRPDSDSDLTTALQTTASGLVALHGCGVRAGLTRDMPAEVAAVRRVLARVAPSLPAGAARAADALLADLAHRAERHPAMTPGPVHGAFRPAQVLLDGGQPGFIDFDGFGVGEPALDVGRFVARLGELWLAASPTYDAGRLQSQRALAGAFVDGYRKHGRLSVARVESWQCLDLAGGVVRSWARAQPARAALLMDLLEHRLAAD